MPTSSEARLDSDGLNSTQFSLFESHLDVQYHIQIYTYKYIKYIKPFYEELQETITVNYPKICTFFKKNKKYTVQDKKKRNMYEWNLQMN